MNAKSTTTNSSTRRIMNTFVLPSSKLSGPSPDKSFLYSPFDSATRQFRSRSLPNQLPYASLLPSTTDAKIMEASRRFSASWLHSPEYLTRPLVLEPIVILPVVPFYTRNHFPTVRSCWPPEHLVRSPGNAFGVNPKLDACFPISSSLFLHPRANHRVDTAYAVASPSFVKNRSPNRSTIKTHRTRGKDLCKRHPRTCKHCLQSTCKGASTRRSKSFRCSTCPKCLTQCSGRCDAVVHHSAVTERRA